MTSSCAELDFLASSTGARLLERLADADLSDANILTLLTALRREVTPSQAGAALELARLRVKAVEKFGADAARMFFTRDALEQASDPLARRYRAKILAGKRVVDICCGIGADALAFAQADADVTGLDIDPVRVTMARLNTAAFGLDARFDVADVRAGIPAADIAFFDPARRDSDGRRIHHVESYEPPLSLIRAWGHPLALVKLSPGVELAQLADYGGCIEFISVNGDLKEALLWREAPHPPLLSGDIRPHSSRLFSTRAERGGEKPKNQILSATLLTAEATYHWQPSPSPVKALPSEPRGWLVEPDPALLRAGLVADVALTVGAYQLDETIAYLTTDVPPGSPWVRAWQILDWMPFNAKHLRAYLRERRVGHVTVKKRGSAVTPDALIPQLKLKGSESRTLVLTRCQGRQIVIVCDDMLH